MNKLLNQICRFPGLLFKNDDDYDSDNKTLMPMQDHGDFDIQNINSDNETDSVVDSITYQNIDDDSDYRTLHEDPPGTSDDEE